MKKLGILLIIGWLIPIFVQGQTTPEKGVYYIAGVIIDQQTKDPIPYVRLQVNRTNRGAMTNSEGFFRIPVGILDTLHLSHIGYEEIDFLVDDYIANYQGDKSGDILTVHVMKKTDYYIDEVTIFQYNSAEEIRTAIGNMELPKGTPEQLAAGNLTPEIMAILMESTPQDGGEVKSVGAKIQADAYQSANLLPTASLNPIQAIKSLKNIISRLKKQKSQNLNDW